MEFISHDETFFVFPTMIIQIEDGIENGLTVIFTWFWFSLVIG